MEKLQAAIEKARVKREAAVPAQRAAARSRPTADAWDALAPFELNHKALSRSRVFLESASREASGYDMLRTKVLQQCAENGWKRLVITSPTKACGKTTTCANLAASFTRQTDRKLILFDIDMRRPELARILDHRAEYSFSSVLEDRISFAEQAVRLSPNVAVSVNQAPAPNPSKLILQDRTAAILDEIEAVYKPDLMIFDTPPMLVTDDTLAFLKYADCALIIAAADSSTTVQVDNCEKEIAEQTNVMGVVLNKCSYASDGYGYDYKY